MKKTRKPPRTDAARLALHAWHGGVGQRPYLYYRYGIPDFAVLAWLQAEACFINPHRTVSWKEEP
jgi:hypothetical protein